MASVALWMSATGCGVSSPSGAESQAPGSTPRAAVASALARIDALVGDARCDADADCRSSPLGASPCGGPDGYLAWSVRVTDEAELVRALGQHARLQRRMAEQMGLSGTCVMVLDPGVHCLRSDAAVRDGLPGRCTLRRDTAPAGRDR